MADYDVIVVGCGPAGLMACGELARRGVKVLGVDKNPDPGRNTRTASGYCFLDQPFNNCVIRSEEKPEENRTYLHFDEIGFTTCYSGIMQGVYHSYMFSDTGKWWRASTTKKPFYQLFDPGRCKADRYEWALAKGAEFMPETLALHVDQSDTDVRLTVRSTGRNKTLTCKKMIASDGLSSRMAKESGANRARTFFGKGPTIEYEMVGVDVPYDRGDMFFFGADNFGGMAGGIIMVPSPIAEDAYRLETISVLPASTAEKLIEYFVYKGPYAGWFKKAEIVDKSGALVEMLTPMLKPHLGNILFVGDSAAWLECLYQSATMAGYMGGLCVQEELEGKNGFDHYTRFWEDHFEWVKNPVRMADYMKRVMFPRFFTVKELDFLFDLSQKHPIVMEEAEATPYDFTTMVMENFIAMDEVPEELKERMRMVINADMSVLSQLIGKVQKS